MYLCVVISSIGKTDSLRRLLRSLEAQSVKAFDVGICDQSQTGAVSAIASEFRQQLNISTVNSRKGLSRGRNEVVTRASSKVTHFVFPNDSSYLEPDFVSRLYTRHHDVDVLALSYVHDGRPRYTFASGSYLLDRNNVWKIIEPAMVLSRRAMDMAGPFDVNLGTGCDTPWQSGEGTDLLLRLLDGGLVIAWDSDIRVEGVSQEHGLNLAERRIKLRSYGRGYGYVLTRWRYPYSKRILCVLGPYAQLWKQGFRSESLLDAAYSSFGRLEGLVGGAWERRVRNKQDI